LNFSLFVKQNQLPDNILEEFTTKTQRFSQRTQKELKNQFKNLRKVLVKPCAKDFVTFVVKKGLVVQLIFNEK
jgi:hypothetical protein